MVVALATSKKARRVSQTEIGLSSQSGGDELFGSSRIGRRLVRWALSLVTWVRNATPLRVRNWFNRRFNVDETIMEQGASFDLIRGSVNLVLAGALIAVGTSLREVKTALLNNWQGCMMTKNGFYVSRKYENIEINDRVGGGDSFASGLIWGMLEGHEEQDIIDFATAFSALCHTIRNDWNLVSREEAEALAKGGSARVKR